MSITNMPFALLCLALLYSGPAESADVPHCNTNNNNNDIGLPRSCKQILAANNQAPSGLYDINSSNGKLRVFCEMVIGGGGFTFLPRRAASFLSDGDLENLYTERNRVLLRIQRTDGRQSYTEIRQMNGRQIYKISVQRNQHHGFTSPVNHGRLGNYIFLGLLPSNVARAKDVQGFTSNGRPIHFRNCDFNPNSFFALYENAKEALPSSYHANNLVYERQGVAVNWRRSGMVVNSLRNLPNQFFFLTELHFGGCGTYTSSDRWGDAIGTAIGLR